MLHPLEGVMPQNSEAIKRLTRTEQGLAAIWADALGKDANEMRPDDDFVNLGGDSLDAAECLLKVHETFGVELPVGLVLGDSASLRSVAARIDELLGPR
jgi:acyl carrier protein